MSLAIPVQFRDTAPEDLCLTLDRQPIDPVATVCIDDGNWQLELRVLSASHQVIVREADAIVFTETVACGDDQQVLPATHQQLAYRFTSSAQAVDENLEKAVQAIAGNLPEETSVSVVFPGDPNAITALTGALHNGHAEWRTWHVYPQSNTVVTTSSTWTPPAGVNA